MSMAASMQAVELSNADQRRKPMPQVDWLSQLLKMITVTGRLEVRCNYGAPWRVAWAHAAPHEIPSTWSSRAVPSLRIRRQERPGN